MKKIDMNHGWQFSYSTGTAALDKQGRAYKNPSS